MALGPWAVTGPWIPSQLPDAIRRRYIRVGSRVGGNPSPSFGPDHFGGGTGQIFPRGFGFSQQICRLKGRAGLDWESGSDCCSLFGGPDFDSSAPHFLVWWEMKIAAHIQVRLGPMRVGRFHGVLQTIADGIKLLLKEDLVPEGADKIVHFVAPLVAVAPALICFAPIPLGHAGLAPVKLDVGLLFVLGISGLSVIGLLMAGWGSNNKYSMLGGLRAAAQVVSYEIPRVIALLPVVMWAGSLSLGEIMIKQSGLWAGFLPKWFIFYPIVGQISFHHLPHIVDRRNQPHAV
jgi:hypothetical protein